jgi:hypothetical protein
MPAPKRRRWFSLSLRTLLIGVTLIRVLFSVGLHALAAANHVNADAMPT